MSISIEQSPQAHSALAALLVRMLNLSPEDSRLPLPLISRIHTHVLRAPLVNAAIELAELSSDVQQYDERLNDMMTLRYPLLRGGDFFKDDVVVDAAYTAAFSMTTDLAFEVDEAREPRVGVRRLVATSGRGWQAYDPLVLLYLLAVKPEHWERYALLLNAELMACGETRAMILDHM